MLGHSGGANAFSLHELSRTRINDLLDYIDRCKPGLEARIRNFSYILPRLMTWGLPSDGLRVEKLRLDNSSASGDDAFNRMFPLPASVQDADFQLPIWGTEMNPWPLKGVVGDSVPEVVT